MLALAGAAQREIMLFAAVGLTIGGLDDLCIDVLYVVRRSWRRWAIYRRHEPMTTATLPEPSDRRPLAVFVPAWREADVIGPMLRSATARWGAGPYRIFVGAYPNDPQTIAQIATVAAEGQPVTLVINDRDGPTTKADCLNALWRTMCAEEKRTGTAFKAVVLHDAEDVVHADELRLLSVMIDRFDLVQLPVLPLASQQSQWIAGQNYTVAQFRQFRAMSGENPAHCFQMLVA